MKEGLVLVFVPGVVDARITHQPLVIETLLLGTLPVTLPADGVQETL